MARKPGEQDIGNPLPGTTIPLLGNARLWRRRIEYLSRRLKNRCWVGANYEICSLLARDGTLSIPSQSEAGHVQHCGFLLNAAAVGQHHTGASHQSQKSKIPQRLNDAYTFVKLNCGHPLRGARVSGENDRNVIGDRIDRVEQALQCDRFVHIRWSMKSQ